MPNFTIFHYFSLFFTAPSSTLRSPTSQRRNGHAAVRQFGMGATTPVPLKGHPQILPVVAV